MHWGQRDPIAPAIAHETVPGVEPSKRLHPTKLFLTGLVREDGSQGDIDRLAGKIGREFHKYGRKGAGVKVLIRGAGKYAFVECGSAELTDQAIKEMRSKYGLTRGTMSSEEAYEYDQEEAKKAQEVKDMAWD